MTNPQNLNIQTKINRIPQIKMSKWFSTILIILFAFLLGGILIYLIGANPFLAYGALLQAAFGDMNGIAETMVKACPLMLAGLGIAIAYRAKFWNIGAEGQIYAGGIASAIAGIYFTAVPGIILLPITLLAGLLGGAILGFIPGILKARYKVNEVITTIMINYVMIQLTAYLVTGPMRDSSSGITISPQLSKAAWLPTVIPKTRFHLGIILAILAAFIVSWLVYKTVLGYQIRAVGERARTARFAGIPVERTIVLTMIISGSLAGLAGAVEVSGVQHRLVEAFSPGYGFLSIAVALLANLEPIGVIISSILFAALLNGADAMQRAAAVPIPVIYVIEGVVIIFIALRVLHKEKD
jgi:simple sugar transport system permease protein